MLSNNSSASAVPVGNTAPLVQPDPFAELRLAASLDLYAVDTRPQLEPIFKAYAEGKPIPKFYYPPPVKPFGPRAQNMPPPPPPKPIQIVFTREELARGVTQFGVKIDPAYRAHPAKAPYKPKTFEKPPTFEEANPGCVSLNGFSVNSTKAVVGCDAPTSAPAGQETVRSTTAVVGVATAPATAPVSTIKSTAAVVGSSPAAPAKSGYISLANYPPPPPVPASLRSHLSTSTTAATVASPITPPLSPPSRPRTIKPEAPVAADDENIMVPSTPASPPTPIFPGAYPQCVEYQYPAVPIATPSASPVSTVSKKVPGAYPEYPEPLLTPPASPVSISKSVSKQYPEYPASTLLTPPPSPESLVKKLAAEPEAKRDCGRIPPAPKRVPVPSALIREFGSSKAEAAASPAPLQINKDLPSIPLPPQYGNPEHIKAMLPKTKPYTGPPRPLPDCYYPPILDTSGEATIVPRRA